MVAKVFPFGVGWFSVFLAGPPNPALVDEPPVVGNDLFRIDRDVSLGGIEVEVAE